MVLLKNDCIGGNYNIEMYQNAFVSNTSTKNIFCACNKKTILNLSITLSSASIIFS